jgi:PAS domain S-box-containing protein
VYFGNPEDPGVHGGERAVRLPALQPAMRGALGGPLESTEDITPVKLLSQYSGALRAASDITRRLPMRREPELSRQQTTEWYQLLIEDVQDYAIFLIDREGRVTSWNAGAERVLGWTEAEILGQPASRLFTPENVVDGVPLQELAKAAADGRAEDDRWHIRKDGSRFWASGILTAVRNEGGALIGFGKILRDLTVQKQLEEQLRASLQEKEVLLKEIYHRVKNNLQVISSLLSLQAEMLQDREVLLAFQDCQARIQSMALVHEVLYQSSNLAQVNFGDYARRLAADLLRAQSVAPERIRLIVETDEVWLSAEKAVPCGLILNELLTNCVKHAFPAGRAGDIRIVLRADAEAQVTISVSDTGVGFPEGLDFRNAASLGMQLACLLTEQLGGTIDLERAEGTAFTIRFSVF